MEHREWDTYYNSIGRKDVEVGTLLGKGSEVARVTRMTKTRATAMKVMVEDLVTVRKNVAGEEIKIQVMLNKGYSGGGLEVGTGGRWYWHVTDEDAVQETLAEAAKADIERKRKRAEAKVEKQADLEKALALLGNLRGKHIEGPFNLSTATFDSPRERYGKVQFVYSVEDAKELNWHTGKSEDVKEVEVAAWYVEYPGEEYERMGKSSHSSVKAKSVRLALAEVIVSWYL